MLTGALGACWGDVVDNGAARLLPLAAPALSLPFRFIGGYGKRDWRPQMITGRLRLIKQSEFFVA